MNSESELGTFSRLVEMGKQAKATPSRSAPRSPAPAPTTPPTSAKASETLATAPYNSQNYRFTDDELHWLREQSFALSARFGVRVSQNTVIRFAIRHLRAACTKEPDSNPLTAAIEELPQ